MFVSRVALSDPVSAGDASSPQRGNSFPLEDARSSPRIPSGGVRLARHVLPINPGESSAPGRELTTADDFVKLLDSLDSSQQQQLIDIKLKETGREKGTRTGRVSQAKSI